MIFDSTTSGAFHAAGDTDSFTLALDAGQTLTLELTPIDGAVQGRIAVVGPDGTTLLGAADGAAAGQTVLLQTVPVAQAGTYRIDASSIAGIGRYRVRTVLNAMIATETNNTRETAQSLESSFISLAGTATRGAVRGSVDGINSDWYSFTLHAGEVSTLALTDTLLPIASNLSFELYNSDNVLLAIARRDATNVDRYIADFVPTATGTYYARIGGTTVVGYSLLLTRGATFGLQLQNSQTQDISAADNVLGYSARLGNAQRAAYLVSNNVGEPWGSSSNVNEMNVAFPSGWDRLKFETVNVTELLSTHGFIFLEGSDANANELNVFLQANLAQFEQYVRNGNSLFINAGPNEGSNINFGFGGVTLRYSDSGSTATIVDANHPIFLGPNNPVIATYTGNSFSHASVSGGGITPLLRDNTGGDAVLAELKWGEGTVLFGGMTTANFHGPQPQANNLLANILSYGASRVKTAVPYVFNAVAGDHLVIETHTPNDGLGGLYNALSLKLAIYAPNGAVIPAADYTYAAMADGRNVRIEYTVPNAASGVYRVTVGGLNSTEGNYVLSVTGATGSAARTLQVTSSSVQNGTNFGSGQFPNSLQFTFSDSVLLSSLSTASLSVNGQTPSAFTIIDGQTINFDLTGLNQGDGLYNVQLGALYDIHGNALAAFDLSFNYDSQPPVVSAVSVAADAVLAAEALDLRVTFSEALDPNYLSSSNVVLINAQTGAQIAASSFTYDAVTRQLRVLFPVLNEGTYQLSLNNAGYRDLAGNRLNGGSNFAVSFAVDAATRSYPTPLADKQPAGSLIFDNTTLGAFHTTGDADSFMLALVAGQILTLELTPIDGAVQGRIVVVGLDGATVLATVDAQAPGQTGLLQTIPVTQTGTYRIDASSIAGIGRYRVRTVLNALIAVDANSTQQTAQSLEGSFISLGGTATRGAARGNFDGTNSDWYSFTLNAGEASTLALTDTLPAPNLRLEIYDSNNALLAIARNDATNVDRYIADFVPTATGTYYARISGTTAVAYSLLLTQEQVLVCCCRAINRRIYLRRTMFWDIRPTHKKSLMFSAP
ncbi:pre-peptidase C-terminal domain-containing protein [Polaromonas sp. P2-4]|nr:pre-peptidase C-terminal domain-containing protein [Polaromonas sp. P2-4]